MNKKITIDARMISSSGIGTYLQSLLSELIQNKEFQWTLLGEQNVLSQMFSNARMINANSKIYSLREQIELALKGRGADCFHSPHYNAPVFLRTPLVVTVHDLIHFRYPEYFGKNFKVKAARLLMKSVLRRAKRIIAVSDATCRDLIKMFRISPLKIHIIHEGAGNRIVKINDEQKIFDCLRRHNLKPDYFLFVGNMKSHKNLVRLLEVFNALKREGLPEDLVIVGAWDEKSVDRNKVEMLLKSEGVRYLGVLDDEALSTVFSFAKGLISPSLWEGFGLPILEAYKLGAPVACSRIPSHEEIVGGKGLYFDPYSVSEMKSALSRLSNDNHLRISLITNGSQRITQFSWKKAAEKTLKVYREVIESR
jgi:glycosyltransferase involved in cell wall biosynthesis